MKLSTQILCVFVAFLAIGLLTSCKSGPQVSTAPADVTQPAQRPAATQPEIAEEVVQEPVTESIPSVEVTEELPEDIRELNRRGYLQDVFFDTDKYDLKPESREALATNASWLQSHMTINILIEGHCDERNTREYNLALGERRASAVRDYLVFLGVDSGNVRIISYGEERPFALGHDESAWSLNRRAHFVITAR
ncbi:MAG: peptidoglycan-associated lipoprotein Pal [bacterium]|nr:peptidoglycan-associated lipoprotein Pal [bacterium]